MATTKKTKKAPAMTTAPTAAPIAAPTAEHLAQPAPGVPGALTAPPAPAENKDMFLRQRGLVNMDRLAKLPITIIGAGAIGSGALLALAQMGARDITIYDNDKLEIHNISNQIYPQSYVGKSKVEAARDFIELMYGFKIKIVEGLYDGKCKGGVIVSGVDSMASRKAIWELVKVHQDAVLYVDARMGALNFVIYNEMMVKLNHDEYERTLVDDTMTLDLPCPARSIGFNVMVIGGYIASQVRNYLARQQMPPSVSFDMATNEFTKTEHSQL